MLGLLVHLIDTRGVRTDPVLFSGATVDRLRRIGWLVIVASVIMALYRIVIWNVLAGLLPEGVHADQPSVMGVPLTGLTLWLGTTGSRSGRDRRARTPHARRSRGVI